MKSLRHVIAPALVGIGFGFAIARAGAQPVPVLSLNSAEGLQQSWGQSVESRSVAVTTEGGETTDGDGGLHIQARTAVTDGNHYVGTIVPLPGEMDLTGKALVFDARTSRPDATKAFYVRVYNAGENKPAWSFNSWNGQLGTEWHTFHIQAGLCPDGLAWEPATVDERTATRADRIEFIIGTHDDNADVDVFLDNLRVAPKIGTLTDLTKVKPRIADTVLVRDGEPAAIVLHPDTPAGAAAAARVVAAVKQTTGVTLPARPGTADDRIPEQTAIILGSLNSNPAMLLLYARKLTPADQICPGPGGSLVHTVFDPFGKRVNAIVLGASDDAGLAAAADVFSGIIDEQEKGDSLVLGRLFERNYSDAFLKAVPWADDEPAPDRLEKGLQAGQNALDTGRHTSVAGVLATVADRYLLTGHSVEAQLYVKLWDLYVKSAVADPRKFGGPWGFDSDFRSKDVVPGWDVVEEDPSLTDEDRLRTTQALGRWLAEAVVSSCAGAAKSTHVPHNHQTFPALGTMYAGLYFTQHYDVMEGRVWLDIADAIFSRQATYFKPYEDCNGYQWLTNGHLFQYAVARPDFTVFTNGNGRKIIDYCIGTMDNLGYQVPYGDTGSWKCWNSEMICLDIFAFATGDPAALWAANFKRDVKNVRAQPLQFFQLQAGLKPDRFNGVDVWPLAPQYYHSWRAENAPPLERTFDKISFREAMDPDGAYLLLDGLSNGGHKHYDGNSIPRITQFNRIWLADNDYYKSPLKYHNSMMVLRNGESSIIPPYCELIGAGDSGRFGYSRTRVNDYAGVNWDRSIVWLKDRRMFVVLDKLTAQQPGDYQFRLLWHGVGDAELTGQGLLLTQEGPAMWIQVAKGPELTLVDDADLGTNWSGYPYAEPVVRSVSGTATVRLEEGDSYLFATAFHGSEDSTPPPVGLHFVQGMNGIVIDGAGGTAGIALGPMRADVAEGQFVTDADVVVADMGGLSLLGATEASVDGEPLHQSAQPASVDMPDIDAGSALSNVPVAAPVPNMTPGSDAPSHPQQWSFRPLPSTMVLSGNRGVGGSIEDFAAVSSVPEPAEANVFNASSPNSVSALVDGGWGAVEDCVMYKIDDTVQITFELGAPCRIDEVSWKQWWATTSSRKTAYQLDEAIVTLSNDGFVNDSREVGKVIDPGPHPSWGSPIDYRVMADRQVASAVRITIAPKAGTAVYLAEAFIYGKPVNENDVAVAPFTFTRLCTARINPKGDHVVLAATEEGDLIAVRADGRILWSQSFGTKLNDVHAVDINGDGIDEIALARADYNLSLLQSNGEEIWSRKLTYYRKNPYVNVVRSGDLNGDGTPEIICGGENWRFYAFDAEGNELWNFEAVHPSRSGAVADLDGDGTAEVICGTHYYYLSVLNSDGTPRWRAHFGPICWDVDTGSFDGDKTRGVVCGSGDGSIYYFAYDGTRRLAFNTGDEVRDVAAADLDGDGKDEILGASFSTNVYCFGPDAKQKWYVPLGAPVGHLVTVSTAGGVVVVAGTTDGHIATLNGDGKLIAYEGIGSAPAAMTVLDKTVVVATEDGRMIRMDALP